MRRITNHSNNTTKTEKSMFKKVWHFLWYEDSVWSWVANIIVAFVLIKFIVYPALSFMLNTSLPIVAVVSGSMEHKIAPVCDRYLSNGLCGSYSQTRFDICGTSYAQSKSVSLNDYWEKCGSWYELRSINLSTFSTYSYSAGFNTGDVMVVRGKSWQNLHVGDVIVWLAQDGTPIIHRIVSINDSSAVRSISTKGDHNADQISSGLRSEVQITPSRYVGVAVLRIPYLGYVKLWAARVIGYLRA